MSELETNNSENIKEIEKDLEHDFEKIQTDNADNEDSEKATKITNEVPDSLLDSIYKAEMAIEVTAIQKALPETSPAIIAESITQDKDAREISFDIYRYLIDAYAPVILSHRHAPLYMMGFQWAMVKFSHFQHLKHIEPKKTENKGGD